MKYIELFSGIGAFTQSLENVNKNTKCVFAADINVQCAEVYKKNYNIDSLNDITKVKEEDVPKHDFCFFSPPCQAFSKSGKQLGFTEARGTLIYDVFRIVSHHKPKYILMENVRNLVSHDDGNTIKVIMKSLKELGYRIPSKPLILSPHFFGVPQTRERAFLPGVYDPENVSEVLDFKFETFKKKNECSIDDIIDNSFNNDESLMISKKEIKLLNIWDEFYKGIDLNIIGFPIWVDFFKSDINLEELPKWKSDIISKNITLYNRNKKFIDKWLTKYNNLENLTATQRKFEWQAGENIDTIWDGIIQFRPSGIRVKAPTTLPALVAIVQIPIVGKLKRRLSVRECANLQSFSKDFICDDNRYQAYKQFGNSINVKVMEEILKKML
ncbi:MAG: DNA (cytosine-5-)-methyltransferase [bacterium]